MSELRKVVFRLDNTKPGFFDHETDEEREKFENEQREREGLFHRWGDRIVTDSETGAKLLETVAIVEDLDGNIYKVIPELIQFDTEA